MKQWQVLRTVFPEVITDNFEFTDYVEQADRLEYWLDEREYMSCEDYKKGLFVLMVLLTIRPYRIFRFVVAVFIFMCVAANG